MGERFSGQAERLGPKPYRDEVDTEEEEDRLLSRGIMTPLMF